MTPDSRTSKHVWRGTFQSLAVGACVFYLGRELAVWLTVRNVHGFWGFLDNFVAAIAAGLVVLLYERRRQRAVDKLRESEQRFRLVADTAPVLIWMSDTDKLRTHFNKPWLDFTGRSMEQELGNGWVEGVHPDDLKRCLETYTQCFDRREIFKMEYRLRRHDGEYRWIFDIGVPRFTQDHSFAGYIGSCIDVTEQKQAGETQSRLALIVESSDDAIIGTDGSGTITDWNRGAEQLFGYSAGEASGSNISFLSATDHLKETRGTLEKVLNGEAVKRFETVGKKKDGTRIDISLTASPILDSGRVVGVSGIVRDISERKRAEEVLSGMTRKLVEAQEQERTRIARELHDDIAQRLAMLGIDLAQVQENHPDLAPDIGNRIQELGQETIRISTDVQALSHDLHSSQLEYLGLVAGMKSWCREFGERQGMQIDYSHDVRSTLPPEIGVCLFRVLQEALHNAAKHSGVKRIKVRLGEESGDIHLVVSDLGKGFDVQVAREGRGLGLTSMQERVRLANGTIGIQSTPMGGTTIHVRVPSSASNDSARAAS